MSAQYLLDFRYGNLAPLDFPARVWKKAMTATLSHRPDRLAYSDPRGSERIRKALQGYLWRARSLSCGLEQIIIVNGPQQGLDLCARLLLDPGDAPHAGLDHAWAGASRGDADIFRIQIPDQGVLLPDIEQRRRKG